MIPTINLEIVVTTYKFFELICQVEELRWIKWCQQSCGRPVWIKHGWEQPKTCSKFHGFFSNFPSLGHRSREWSNQHFNQYWSYIPTTSHHIPLIPFYVIIYYIHLYPIFQSVSPKKHSEGNRLIYSNGFWIPCFHTNPHDEEMIGGLYHLITVISQASAIPSGCQTWQSNIPEKWRFSEDKQLEIMDFPLPRLSCFITRG